MGMTELQKKSLFTETGDFPIWPMGQCLQTPGLGNRMSFLLPRGKAYPRVS